MKTLKIATVCAAMALAVGVAGAQDMKKDAMGKDNMKHMTMQECKDHMTMAKTDAMKKDPMAMKKDAECTDMMKKDGAMMKDGMKKDGAMMKDGMAPKK